MVEETCNGSGVWVAAESCSGTAAVGNERVVVGICSGKVVAENALAAEETCSCNGAWEEAENYSGKEEVGNAPAVEENGLVAAETCSGNDV